ncbi:DUF1266 domain-containing protein [Paenibacillus elgii]
MDYYDPEVRAQLALYGHAMSSLCMKGQMAFSLAKNMQAVFENKRRLQSALELWEIEDSAALKAELQWLFETGVRKEFEACQMLLSGLADTERSGYLQSLPTGEVHTGRLHVVAYYLSRLPVKGIAAFDYSWCVYLCCAGYHRGYLSEEDQWRIVAMCVRHARIAYASWKDYIIGFAAGADFHQASPSLDHAKKYKDFFVKLLTAPESPLRQVNLR